MPRFVRCVNVCCLTVLVVGCGVAPPVAGPDAAPQGIDVKQDRRTELATELAGLDATQRQKLQTLVEDVSFEPRPAAPTAEDAMLVRALCRLTLSEADELGSQLEAQHAGASTELVLAAVRRQQHALERVRQIHRRLRTQVPGVTEADVMVGDPVIIVRTDLPWLRKRLGDDVKEAIGLSFSRECYDLGPDRTDVSNDEMKLVSVFTGLQRLDLQMAAITDAGLAHLAELRLLQSLNLSDCRVTSAGLRHLTGMPHLAELTLVRTDVASDGLKHLAGCPQLAKLTVAPLPQANVLNQLTSLEEVSCGGVQELQLTALPLLTQLHVGFSREAPALFSLANLPALQNVDADLGLLPARVELRDLPELSRLTLHANLAALPVDQIGQFTNLRELVFSRNQQADQLHESQLQHLTTLRQLVRLHLGGDIETASLQHLAGLSDLQYLTFGGGELDDSGLSSLSQLTNLRELTIYRLRGTGRGFDALQSLPRLRLLTLSDLDIDRLALSHVPALERVHGTKCRIESLELSELIALKHAAFDQQTSKTLQFRDLPQITWLTLSLIRADELQQVTLKNMPRLETLRLIPIHADGSIEQIPYVARIGDALLSDIAEMARLQTLELTYTAISDTALSRLATLPRLGSVNITGPHVTPTALQELRESLKR